MFKNKVSMPVVASSGGGSGYQIKKLTITKNGLYDSEFEAYKPIYVSVPQVAQGGSLKALLDGTKTTYHLFYRYAGTSIDGLISYSDTANVTAMQEMFSNCDNLTTIPLLDTSNVTSMYNMFQYCTNLTTIPLLDTSNVTNMSNMFKNCSNLTTIPQLDTSNVTNMSDMFSRCASLTTIPELNCYKVTDMGYMFYECSNLTTIPQLDASNVSRMYETFTGCTSLTSIGMYGFTCSIDITDTALEHDAIVALLNQAGNSKGTRKITMGSAKLALLSDEEKAIATNKDWTLA